MPPAISMEQKVKNCLSKHPTWEDTRVARTTAAPVGLIRAVRQGAKPEVKTSAGQGGITRAEFMSLHDPTTKMRVCLKEAVKLIGKGRFYKDHELRKMVGASDPALWRALAGDPDEGLTKYQFRMADTVWWTDPESAAAVISTHAKAKAVA